MKKNISKISLYALGLLALPSITHAKTFKDLVENVTGDLASTIIRFIFIVALAYFFWGIVQYSIGQTQESKDQGRSYMLWGVIALTVMFAVYGLIRIVSNTIFQ